jgi:hypothetical protein
MSEKDHIGKRGEVIFAFLIGKKCSGRYWFDSHFLGDKAPTKDFTVSLINPSSGEATFFAQVKATSKGYTGKGANRKLKVNVTRRDVSKLKQVTGPTYIAGIDTELEVGFLLAITDATADSLSGIPCRHRIDCKLIVKLWREIDRYWAKRNMRLKRSVFS